MVVAVFQIVLHFEFAHGVVYGYVFYAYLCGAMAIVFKNL